MSSNDRDGVRYSSPAADGSLYVARRNFEVERQVRAGQRSAATIEWAVHDGQKRVLATGRYGA